MGGWVVSDASGPGLRALRAGAAQEAAVSPALGLFQGVIRVHLLEAEKLAQMDHFLGIRGKSDPYAKVSIGLQHFRSKTVYKCLSPVWNEVFEVRGSPATTATWKSCGLHAGPGRVSSWASGLWAALAKGAGLGVGQDGLRDSPSQTLRVPRGGLPWPRRDSL